MRTCSVCKSKSVRRINLELIGGTSYRDIAGQFRLSKTAVARHKQAHVPEKLALARNHREALSAESLLEEMADMKDRLRRGLEQAEAAQNPVAFIAFAREFRQCLESYFDISARMADRTEDFLPRERAISLFVALSRAVTQNVGDKESLGRILGEFKTIMSKENVPIGE
jgi:hypothetical protein